MAPIYFKNMFGLGQTMYNPNNNVLRLHPIQKSNGTAQYVQQFVPAA